METLAKHKLITGLVSIERVHMDSFVRAFDNHCFLDGLSHYQKKKKILASWCQHERQ